LVRRCAEPAREIPTKPPRNRLVISELPEPRVVVFVRDRRARQKRERCASPRGAPASRRRRPMERGPRRLHPPSSRESTPRAPRPLPRKRGERAGNILGSRQRPTFLTSAAPSSGSSFAPARRVEEARERGDRDNRGPTPSARRGPAVEEGEPPFRGMVPAASKPDAAASFPRNSSRRGSRLALVDGDRNRESASVKESSSARQPRCTNARRSATVPLVIRPTVPAPLPSRSPSSRASSSGHKRARFTGAKKPRARAGVSPRQLRRRHALFLDDNRRSLPLDLQARAPARASEFGRVFRAGRPRNMPTR